MTCVLFKQLKGRWHAYSFCNFGFDHNGVQYGMEEMPVCRTGFATPEAALRSLLPKFAHRDKVLTRDWRVDLAEGIDIDTFKSASTGAYPSRRALAMSVLTRNAIKLKEDTI